MDFVDGAVTRSMAQASWYLTGVQTGSEPWQEGAVLAASSFARASPARASRVRPGPAG